MGELKRIRRELAYEGTILKVYRDHIEINDRNAVWDYFYHGGGAAVLPVTREGKILLVRQYRNAIDRYTLEIPGGVLDSPNEAGETCVVRELEEEAGYLAGKVEHLVDIHSLVAFTNEKTQIFVAWDLTEAEQHLDAEESIELVEYEITELRDMVFAGKIEDAKTVAAILAYLVKYGDEA